MDFPRAFRLTLRKFGIKPADLSRCSGVAEADVSRFLNNRTNCGYKTLDRLIKALPSPASDYMWLVYKANSDVFDDTDRRLSACEKSGGYRV